MLLAILTGAVSSPTMICGVCFFPVKRSKGIILIWLFIVKLGVEDVTIPPDINRRLSNAQGRESKSNLGKME